MVTFKNLGCKEIKERYVGNRLADKYTNLPHSSLKASRISKPIQNVVHLPRRQKCIERHLNLKLEDLPLLRQIFRHRLRWLKYEWKVVVFLRGKHVELTVGYRYFILLNVAHKLSWWRSSNVHPVQLEVIQDNFFRLKLIWLVDLVVCKSDQVRPLTYFCSRLALLCFWWCAQWNLDIENLVKIRVEVAPKADLWNIISTVHLCEHSGYSTDIIIVSSIKIGQVITRANVDWQSLLVVDLIGCIPGSIRKHFFFQSKPLIRCQEILYYHYDINGKELINIFDCWTGDIKETKSKISTDGCVCSCITI